MTKSEHNIIMYRPYYYILYFYNIIPIEKLLKFNMIYSTQIVSVVYAYEWYHLTKKLYT